MKKFGIVALITLALVFAGCTAPQTKTEKGAVYGAAGGAAAGAVIGQAIGRNHQSTLWGTAIGAAVGGIGGAGVGRMMDNQEKEMREALAASEAAAIRREGNLLAVTFKGDVTFDFNSTVVKPGLYAEIDRVAGVLTRYPETLIRVAGHTDSVGSEKYNMDLSIKRANAVMDLLVEQSISSARMEAIGFGKSMPVATNSTEAGRQQNRRVEIKIAPKTE